MAESPTRIVTVNGRKRRPWALASQEKLLQAATDEIAAVGFDRARLTEIAKRAGLTPGSVYTWFKNKEDLFRAAIEHALTKQIESNAHVLDTHKINDVASWLVQIAGLVPRNIKDSGPTATQKLLIEAYYASWRDPKARKKLLPRIREHYEMYERVVVAAHEPDGWNPGLVRLFQERRPVGGEQPTVIGIRILDEPCGRIETV